MADYNSVPPPETTMDQNAAIQDAMARAKQIAARLQNSAPGAGVGSTPSADVINPRKRPVEEPALENGSQIPKRPAPSDATGDPKQVALKVAQSITQRAGLGSMCVEDMKIPNKYVGLIIGRGGEMINKLQLETSARIQVAPDPLPGQQNPERNITITGAPAAVEVAKNIVLSICEEGKVPEHLLAAPNQPGEFSIEHMVPASKVGFIIGKGGETIRNLQERAGCRMVMIQDGPYQNAPDKPLRITGDPQKCQYGKQLVIDLLTEKDLEMEGRGQIKSAGEYGGRGGQGSGGMDRRGGSQSEIPVPRELVGFVIGKNGETIKRIQQETGCKVQFQMPDPVGGPNRMCILQGDPQQISEATQKIQEIIDSPRSSRGPSGSRGPQPNAPGVRSIEVPIPSNKCGVIIGRGGENIRQLNQITGAHMEINRNSSNDPSIKNFIIRGTDSQIQHMQQLIREKLGDQQMYQQYGAQAGAVASSAAPVAASATSNTAAVTSNAGGQSSTSQPDYSAAWALYYQQMNSGYQAQPQQQNPQQQQQQPAQGEQGQAPLG
eukprot:gene16047-17669_t